MKLDRLFVRKKLQQFLEEDIGWGDITTDSLNTDRQINAKLLAKEDFVLAGIDFAKEVFLIVDEEVRFTVLKQDGSLVKKGEVFAYVEGSGRGILKAERLALNIIQRLSGIATHTNRYVEILKPYKTQILDTRKTTPGFRAFEKYAVRVGGGKNHRFALFDMVMIKDNHIKLVGSISDAVSQVKSKVSPMVKVEVEVSNLLEFQEAIQTEADIIMLDNMSVEQVREAVKINQGKKLLEASGNITLDNIVEYAKSGVDFVSTGALIHSARWVDISLKFE